MGLTLREVFNFLLDGLQDFLVRNNVKTVKTVEIRDFNNLTGKDETVFRTDKEFSCEPYKVGSITIPNSIGFDSVSAVNALKDLAFRDFIIKGLPERHTYSVEITGDSGTYTILELP